MDTAREALIEMVAEADEKLMEKFFEAGTLTDEEVVAGLRSATAAAKVFPLVCTSALVNIGVPQLLDAIVSYLPSPAERPYTGVNKDGSDVACAADDKQPPLAFVWKTIADPFAGRITMFRVISGTIKADSTIHNKTRDSQERLGHVALLQGKTQTNVPEIKAGDLGAVAKLKDTLTSDTLGDKASAVTFPAIVFPEPVLSYAIEPKTRGDEDKISTSMHRLEEEDPSIKYSRDPQTKELLLSGQGQLHIEVTVAKLKRRFGVDVNLKPPRIPYRETIKGATEAHGRHKKQTGGHGQFGDCKIKVEPLPRGSDFEFVDDIFGGSIPRQFIPAVEKGIQDARTRGYLAGYPMVDFRVTVFDGSYHDVDSNELSFKLAGSLAFKDAMTRARPTILEPIMNVEVYAPSDFAGDLMGDLNGRRGRIAGMDTRGVDDHHQGAGADVRDAHLRAAPDVGDRRARLLPHGILALRRGAVPPPDEDHRRGEGRARGRRSRRSVTTQRPPRKRTSSIGLVDAPRGRSRIDAPTSPKMPIGRAVAPAGGPDGARDAAWSRCSPWRTSSSSGVSASPTPSPRSASPSR